MLIDQRYDLVNDSRVASTLRGRGSLCLPSFDINSKSVINTAGIIICVAGKSRNSLEIILTSWYYTFHYLEFSILTQRTSAISAFTAFQASCIPR